MRLKGAVVAITGASSGIGEATALAFARQGSRLALGARRLERLNAVAQKCRDHGSPGVIINVASVLGFRAAPYSAVYSATKYAVAGLSHALRGELSGTGVKVCVVYPASTKTEFFAATEAPIGPQYPASWVARLIVRTARFPRRDAIVLPYRLMHLAEPIFGGLVDHSMGEARRLKSPHLSGKGPAPIP